MSGRKSGARNTSLLNIRYRYKYRWRYRLLCTIGLSNGFNQDRFCYNCIRHTSTYLKLIYNLGRTHLKDLHESVPSNEYLTILIVNVLLLYERFLWRFEPMFDAQTKRPAMPAAAPNPDRISAISSRRSLTVLASNGSSATFFGLDVLCAVPSKIRQKSGYNCLDYLINHWHQTGEYLEGQRVVTGKVEPRLYGQCSWNFLHPLSILH